MAKVILHIDLNYFFVRCEEIKDPSLVDKPTLIGNLGRGGIVSTCSYKARTFGIKSGQPTFIAKKLCPFVKVLKPDYHFYDLMSREFIQYLKNYTHKIEVASIDECYLDITDLVNKNTDINKFLKDFQDGLIKKTKLYCSIGVGTTKFIAKMASDYKKPLGITIIRNKDISKMLFPLKVGDFYGIGKMSVPKLEKLGIKTIGDLYDFIKNNNELYLDSLYLDKKWILNCLEGKTSDIVSTERDDLKSIGNGETFNEDTNDLNIINQYIKRLSLTVFERLTKEKKVFKTIQIQIKTINFKVNCKSITLNKYSNKLSDIYLNSYKLFIDNFVDINIRFFSITLQNLKSRSALYNNIDLVDGYYDNNEEKISELLSSINKKMHKKIVKKANLLLYDRKQ